MMGFVQNIESIAVENAAALICTSNVHTVATPWPASHRYLPALQMSRPCTAAI